ncbi:hypothetical protein SAMN04487980_105511 [Streptomyces sp. cf124]|uniref:hypothetical protein n=1 Tax=Streptomyces sp. cf124 TaxID=1761903 RepID=UPI0008EBA046|nr:hypothetical protein [Streptomyces sp. cf124]SFO07477.1 hypothetical protein SAMN04487980_105511 [Streptomyces sp. cf124]
MSPTEIPPTVIIGLHGILQRHPWLDRVVERDPESSVEEDVLGLVIDRAGAYGWQTVSSWLSEGGQVTAHHEPTAWAHEEVGGDWTDDGRVHQLGWVQAGVLGESVLPGLPVRPIALVLSEALARVGEVTFTGLHALVPLRAGERNTAFHQAELAPWFGLADPDARHEVVVTVSGLPSACALDEDGSVAVCDAVRDMAQDSVTDFSASAAAAGLPPGLELDLDRVLHTQGMREVARFGCRTREWSPDVAVWLLEMVADGLRGAGLSTRLVITVSLATPSPAPSSPTSPTA